MRDLRTADKSVQVKFVAPVKISCNGEYRTMKRIKYIRYKLAAWICGGSLHQFEGRTRKGEWRKGLCILSPEAMMAHKAAFRYDANVYSDTALTS